MNTIDQKEGWDWEIKPESFWLRWNLSQLWEYRHLLLRLVRRDFLIHHQQTLLGPVWIVVQPLIVLVTYIVIFEKVVGISTDGLPPALFYLSGIILWNLFSESFTGTAFTFIQHGALFGKVYFPRLVLPLSVIVVNWIRFAIQFTVFLVLLFYFANQNTVAINLQRWVIALVLVIPIVSGLGLGLGLLFSILTAKYRDLVNIIHLGVRLLMFATPVIYPLSIVETDMRVWVNANPLSGLFEFFRYCFLGQGVFAEWQLGYAVVCMVLLLLIGSMFFNKFGNKLQDVI